MRSIRSLVSPEIKDTENNEKWIVENLTGLNLSITNTDQRFHICTNGLPHEEQVIEISCNQIKSVDLDRLFVDGIDQSKQIEQDLRRINICIETIEWRLDYESVLIDGNGKYSYLPKAAGPSIIVTVSSKGTSRTIQISS